MAEHELVALDIRVRFPSYVPSASEAKLVMHLAFN